MTRVVGLVFPALLAAFACGVAQDSVGKVETEPTSGGTVTDAGVVDARRDTDCSDLPPWVSPQDWSMFAAFLVADGGDSCALVLGETGLPADPTSLMRLTYDDGTVPRAVRQVGGAADCGDLVGWYTDSQGRATLGCPATCALARGEVEGGRRATFAIHVCTFVLP